MTKLVFCEDYWSYTPELIPNSQEIFETLLPQLEKIAEPHDIKMYGKVFESRKISCVFSEEIENNRVDAKSKGFGYDDVPTFEWENAPEEINFIRSYIEEFYNLKTDYVLCHIYRGITERKGIKEAGQDYIGWHNDREAMTSNIISISLGTKRRFQFREINGDGVYREISLKSGDVVHMFGGADSCQANFKHQVPKMTISDLTEYIEEKGFSLPKGRKTYKSITKFIEENNISPNRINLTFRQYE